nr:MAG TPA: hypothetical protein [Caudoviricetes sp.]
MEITLYVSNVKRNNFFRNFLGLVSFLFRNVHKMPL